MSGNSDEDGEMGEEKVRKMRMTENCKLIVSEGLLKMFLCMFQRHSMILIITFIMTH
jgi:hypothetical protein